MIVTPIDARERSIEELTGHKPGKGTRMYVGQRRSDPDFVRDGSPDRMRNPRVKAPTGPSRQRRGPPGHHQEEAAPPPPVTAPEPSPGTTLLEKYVDSCMVEGPSLKPWKSPWEEAMEHPSGWIDTSYSQVMRQYRPSTYEGSTTAAFKRTGTALGPHRRSQTAPAGEPAKPLVKSRELVAHTSGRKARGVVMFDRMKKRSEQFVVDESNVASPKDFYARRRIEILQQSRPRVPSPPPHVGTGYQQPKPQQTAQPRTQAPRPQTQQRPPQKMSLLSNISPWEAAEYNPSGSVEQAFSRSHRGRVRPSSDQSLVNTVQEAARTKAERTAYEISPWLQSNEDQLSYRLPPKITMIPRVRIGAQPYVNDFNRKAEGWERLPDSGHTATECHTLPRRREPRGHQGDFNPRPKSWAPAEMHHEFHHQPDEIYGDGGEEEPVEHLKPVRQTARKFDRPSYDRRRVRPSNVKPVPGPNVWNPALFDETDDL